MVVKLTTKFFIFSLYSTLKIMLTDVNQQQEDVVIIYYNNIFKNRNPIFYSQTKHIDIKYH